MKKRAAGVAARFAFLFALTTLLSACVVRGPFIPANLAPGARASVELDGTPFFPQKKYQCGPAALASVLVASDVVTTPEALVPLVYHPGAQGQPAGGDAGGAAQVRAPVVSAVAEPGFHPRRDSNAGRPVLVLHNYGLPIFRGGTTPSSSATTPRGTGSSCAPASNDATSGARAHSWWRGTTLHRWAMVVLRPGEIPVIADPTLYLRSRRGFRTRRESRGCAARHSMRLSNAGHPRPWPGSGAAPRSIALENSRKRRRTMPPRCVSTSATQVRATTSRRRCSTWVVRVARASSSRPSMSPLAVAAARGGCSTRASCRRRGGADLRRQTGLRDPVSDS